MFAICEHRCEFRNLLESSGDHFVESLAGYAAGFGKFAQVQFRTFELLCDQSEGTDIQSRHECDDFQQIGAGVTSILFRFAHSVFGWQCLRDRICSFCFSGGELKVISGGSAAVRQCRFHLQVRHSISLL